MGTGTVREKERGREACGSEDEILVARIETQWSLARRGGLRNALRSKRESERRTHSRIADPQVGPAAAAAAAAAAVAMEQSIEPSFFVGSSDVAGCSIDFASIGSQANYAADPIGLGILSDGAPKLAFHLFDSARGEYDQLFVADAVFEREETGEKGAEIEKEEKEEAGVERTERREE